MLHYAHSLGIIASIPAEPAVTIIKKSRGSYLLDEYRLLLWTARRQIGHFIAVRSIDCHMRGADKLECYVGVGADLHMFIGFVVNNFVHPSGIKNVLHKQVT